MHEGRPAMHDTLMGQLRERARSSLFVRLARGRPVEQKRILSWLKTYFTDTDRIRLRTYVRMRAVVLVAGLVVLIYVDMWCGFLLLDRVDTYWGIVQRDDGSSVGRMRSYCCQL
jgi:hypothetical protein